MLGERRRKGGVGESAEMLTMTNEILKLLYRRHGGREVHFSKQLPGCAKSAVWKKHLLLVVAAAGGGSK